MQRPSVPPPSRQEIVDRALHRPATTVENVGVDHGPGNVAVTEEFLDGADVVPSFQKMRREAMAERVRSDGLGDGGRASSGVNGLLHDRFVQMMPATNTGEGIDAEL